MNPLGVPIQYVAAWGNDANNGVSMSTPKLTVLAAYDAVPAGGGRIECLFDVTWGGEVAGQGLWIDNRGVGLSPGWRAQKTVTIVGVGGSAFAQHQYAPGVYISGHSQTDITKPAMWFCGIGSFRSIRFENIYVKDCAKGVVIGTLPNGSSPSGFCLGIEMDNCGVEIKSNTDASFGPAFTFDGGATGNFWMSFTRIFARGNNIAAYNSDQRAAVKATGRNYLLYFHDWRTHSGSGFRLYGADRTFFDIRRHLMEGTGTPANDAPPIETFAGTGTVKGVFEDISSDDASIVAARDIVIHSTNGLDISVNRSGKVSGPFRAIDTGTPGAGDARTGGTVEHPTRWGAVGYFSNRIIGQSEAGKRLLGGVAVRAANKAKATTAGWTGRSHGVYPATNDATITGGRRGPHGGTTAGRINGVAGQNFSLTEIANSALTLAVGDIVVFGAWVRAASPSGWPVNGFQPSQVTMVTSGFTFTTGSQFARYSGGGPSFNGSAQEWQWIWGAAQVATIGTNPCTTTLSLNSQFNYDVDAMPGLLAVLPASEGHTLTEGTEWIMNASSWAPGADQGDVSLMLGQNFTIPGGLLKFSDGTNVPDVFMRRHAAATVAVGVAGTVGNSLEVHGPDGSVTMVRVAPYNHLDQSLTLGVNTSGGGNPKSVLSGTHGMWLQRAGTTVVEIDATTGLKLGMNAGQLVGMHGSAVAKEAVTGSRGGNAALADLLTKLANKGILTDSTSA